MRALVAIALLGCGGRAPPDAPRPPADASRPRAPDDAAAPAPSAVIPPSATQLVVVAGSGWDDTRATLRRYERAGDAWRPVGDEVPAVLGRSGLAWGRGLHGEGAPAGRPGPVKREGDGRSTAGVFRLGAVHGRDPAAPPGARVPYTPLGRSWRCVDDPRSSRYNQVLDAAAVEKDWSSAEDMWAVGPLYDLLVIVEHNAPPSPGAGSCIFLHVWRGPDDPTAGCTAIPKGSLAELIAWLRPEEAVLVALPADELAQLRGTWRLP